MVQELATDFSTEGKPPTCFFCEKQMRLYSTEIAGGTLKYCSKCLRPRARLVARYEILKSIMQVAEYLLDDGITIVLFGGVVRDGGIGLDGKIGDPLKGKWFMSDSDIDIGFMGDTNLVLSSIMYHGRDILSATGLDKKLGCEPYCFGWTHEYTVELRPLGRSYGVNIDLVKMGSIECKIDADVNSLAWTPEHHTHPIGFVVDGEYKPLTLKRAQKKFKMSENYLRTIRKRLESRTATVIWGDINGRIQNAYNRTKKLEDRGFKILNPKYNFANCRKADKRDEEFSVAEKVASRNVWELKYGETLRVLKEKTSPDDDSCDEIKLLHRDRARFFASVSRALDRRTRRGWRTRSTSSDDDRESSMKIAVQKGVIEILEETIDRVRELDDQEILLESERIRKEKKIREENEKRRKEEEKRLAAISPHANKFFDWKTKTHTETNPSEAHVDAEVDAEVDTEAAADVASVVTCDPGVSSSGTEPAPSQIIYTKENKAEGKEEVDIEFILMIKDYRE